MSQASWSPAPLKSAQIWSTAALALLGGIALFGPVAEFVAFSRNHVHYSHAVLIPFLTLALLWYRREAIFQRAGSSPLAAFLCVIGSAVLYGFWTISGGLLQNDALSLAMASAVLLAYAAFLLLFGAGAFAAGAFPLLFLLFVVPLPSPLLNAVIVYLQVGSAEATDWLFRLIPVPVYREGLFFQLPGLVIHVAKECSGIRSSMALLITGLLAAYLVIPSWWKRLLVVAVIVPLAVFKNGVRIVAITLLTLYVDDGFMTGDLHSRGGVVFFIFSLALLFPFVLVLAGSERIARRSRFQNQASKAASRGSKSEG